MTSLFARDLLPFVRAMDRLGEDRGFDLSCELQEDKDKFIAKFEVPGIPKDKIKIELNDNILTVSGEREAEKKDNKRHYTEFSYGSFTRSFSLPSQVESGKVSAVYENGILTVSVPKSEETKPKQIPIQ